MRICSLCLQSISLASSQSGQRVTGRKHGSRAVRQHGFDSRDDAASAREPPLQTDQNMRAFPGARLRISAVISELVSFLLLSLDFVFHGSFPSLMSYRCLFCSLFFRALHMIRSQCQARRCSSERQQRGRREQANQRLAGADQQAECDD